MSGRRGLNLSAAQVIASVLATLTAAVAASFLGVAGTLVGAAVGSVVSTMGTEIYKHYLQRSEERLRSAGQVLYHSAARTGTGNTNAQAGAASGGRHAAYQGSAGQQGVTRDLGNRDVAGQDPANQETAVWDRRQYGTPRDPHETQTISGFGTEWAARRTAGSPTAAHRTAGRQTAGRQTAGTAPVTAPASTLTGASPRKGRTATQRAQRQRVGRDHQLLRQPDPAAVADLRRHRRDVLRHRHQRASSWSSSLWAGRR